MLNFKEVIFIKRKIKKKEGNFETHKILKALGDKNRFKIFKTLILCKKLCVSDISKILDSSLSLISNHLKILELSGIVAKKRIGKEMCYFINKENKFIKKLAKII